MSIYKHWHFSTGKIEQYYFPNMHQPEILSHHRLESANIPNNDTVWNLTPLSLEKYMSLEDKHIIFKESSKYKSKNYYINRYYHHPIYKYLFLAVTKDHDITSIIIARKCGNAQSTCLRIVDYIGKIDYLPNISYDLQEFMFQQKYEYIDFISVGINPDIMEKAGFINRKNNPETIIPNYFEPFLKENVDLDYAFKSVNPNADILFYKADADQDRPNSLP